MTKRYAKSYAKTLSNATKTPSGGWGFIPDREALARSLRGTGHGGALYSLLYFAQALKLCIKAA